MEAKQSIPEAAARNVRCQTPRHLCPLARIGTRPCESHVSHTAAKGLSAPSVADYRRRRQAFARRSQQNA